MSPRLRRSHTQNGIPCRNSAQLSLRTIGPASYSTAQMIAPHPPMTMNNNITISLSPQARARILASIKKMVLNHHINVGGVSYDAWTSLGRPTNP